MRKHPLVAREIMTANPTCVTEHDSVQMAARLMIDLHCGALPVVDEQVRRHLVGIVTDRDLALRVIAPGRPVDTPIGEVMSTGVSCCLPDTRFEEVEEIMAQRQVRRVPVVDDRGDCIGIIALGDLAHVAETHEEPNEREVGRVLERVSEASDQARSEVEVGVYPERLAAAQPHPVP
jgi:CBS domain-containing protein